MMNQTRISLGKTDIEVSQIGTGTWQWGDRRTWGYGKGYDFDDIQASFHASMEAGINLFDTAEIYGLGQSEKLIGGLLNSETTPVIIATKFLPYPWRLTRSSLKSALKQSLKRLGLEQIDLYQIHWPLPPISIEVWAEALAEVVHIGLVKAVGVSNYNETQMRRAYSILAKKGIPLASNQVSYSLLNRKIEFNGLLVACRDLDITLIAYSPLEKGLLTGKYSADNTFADFRSNSYHPDYLEKIQPLIRKMGQIGRDHDNKSTTQVAINWLICKGALPIPGAKNANQVSENSGGMGWQLNQDAIAILDEMSEQLV